jgi:hypothetical protein
MANYDQVATRWRDRILGRTNGPNLSNPRMPCDNDSIYSYGSHFELARIIRDRKGAPSHWLINGDRWGTVTGRHQSVVRGAIERQHLPSVIIPHSALVACGIVFDSIQIVDVQPDWNESGTIVSKEFPQGAKWEYDWNTVPGTGGYWRGLERVDYEQAGQEGVEWVDYQTRNTGRRHLASRGRQWYLADDGEGGIEYRHDWFRHFLGGSVIRAQVNYTVWVKCPGCGGTGKAEPWEDWRGDTFDHCRECTGFRDRQNSGRRRRNRQRWAYFLSGFDAQETRPSYFLCELAPGVKPETYADAVESLKTEAVRFAESIGREVRRQGDIWAIPVPTATLADLKAQGGVKERLGNLLGTNHRATEVVRLNGQTFARGTLRHVPEGRMPDHKMVSLGKTWHIIQKNTVPTVSSGRR